VVSVFLPLFFSAFGNAEVHVSDVDLFVVCDVAVPPLPSPASAWSSSSVSAGCRSRDCPA
jgi:hypothetical protein